MKFRHFLSLVLFLIACMLSSCTSCTVSVLSCNIISLLVLLALINLYNLIIIYKYYLHRQHWLLQTYIFFYMSFSLWVSWQFTNQGTAGEGGISLTLLYHFHPLYRHLDLNWAITAESSPLYIASVGTPTGNLGLVPTRIK